MTTSLKVAEVFGKMHKDVLKAIQNLDCSEDFRGRNFALTEIEIQAGPVKRMSPMYLMTRDGFTFLAMGFTGARAAEFKERYIAEFNRMEAKTFVKEHKHDMNDIRKLIDKGLPNFRQTSYTHPQNGQQYRMYLIDHDGFTLLAMGFAGEAASSVIIWNYTKVSTRYF
ncbi:Rha family transcriptional regulator [Desulfomicrobium baculatum]|uniref:Phage regulatory protein, Rha family n=1 Tax=Desulfomicrobium baculatum (strain DSM 4028 / VKM B-1378 / X) TaxID=525897 RepID=C7LPH0_DESBD|nr:Rha family transcriptional regulator [Desulfomicrobium baculatum]ACU89013.1 phage regulatory protein, Rha family [Desulfomicrobium baculatum DSM 4028]